MRALVRADWFEHDGIDPLMRVPVIKHACSAAHAAQPLWACSNIVPCWRDSHPTRPRRDVVIARHWQFLPDLGLPRA